MVLEWSDSILFDCETNSANSAISNAHDVIIFIFWLCRWDKQQFEAVILGDCSHCTGFGSKLMSKICQFLLFSVQQLALALLDECYIFPSYCIYTSQGWARTSDEKKVIRKNSRIEQLNQSNITNIQKFHTSNQNETKCIMLPVYPTTLKVAECRSA